MRSYEDQLEVARVFGIPFEWFHQVDRACEAWLKKRGLNGNLSLREQIENDRRLREQQRLDK